MLRVIEDLAKSLKVIKDGGIRKLGYGFLFAFQFRSNCGRIFSYYYYYNYYYYYKCHGLQCCHHTVAGALYKI